MDTEKTLNNTTANQAKDQVSDIQFWGNGDAWKLLSKASSKKEGWMKSTKAYEIEGRGCMVQVTTQQGDQVAEALQWVPDVTIEETYDQPGGKENGGKVISRRLVPIPEEKRPPVHFHNIFDYLTKEGLKGSMSISADTPEELEEAIEKWKAAQSRVDL